ncbi:MAG TPA: hypothetical protein VG498_23705, partial [Terriglobales bacterium]|nr:hypothetical protein [Terriglobales bacterium]
LELCVSRPTNGWMRSRSTFGTKPGVRRLKLCNGRSLSGFFVLGVTAIIEWGTWGRSERDALRLGARKLGAAVELHYLSATLDVLFERLQRRGMETPLIRREQLLEWSEAFQAPTAAELGLFDASLIL